MKSLMSLVLAALAMPLILSCALAGDEGATVERANPDPEASEDYWTPERLQGARPPPLPQPTTPPPEAAQPEKPDRQASVSEAGVSAAARSPWTRATTCSRATCCRTTRPPRTRRAASPQKKSRRRPAGGDPIREARSSTSAAGERINRRDRP